MAEKRMFAKSIIDSDLFLDMPADSQLLYFHLAMRADDDGFVDRPKAIMRSVGLTAEDMKVLLDNGYILEFDSGIIVISHWLAHNTIQKDRYHKTVHTAERDKLTVQDKIYTMDTSCIQSVSKTDTQIRLDKIRLEREGEEISPTPAFLSFGSSRKVKLTQEQFDKLCDDFGRDTVKEYIEKLDFDLDTNGRTRNNHARVIRKWISEDRNKDGGTSTPEPAPVVCEVSEEEREKERAEFYAHPEKWRCYE